MSAPKHPRHLVTNAFPGGSTIPKVGVVLCELHFCDSRAAPAMLCSRRQSRIGGLFHAAAGPNTQHRTALVALISSYPPPASRLNSRFTIWAFAGKAIIAPRGPPTGQRECLRLRH